MRRWITSDDFTELLAKVRQRGTSYLFSKFTSSATKRVQSTFGESSFQHANWWIIPAVRARWNKKVSGDPNKDYESYFVEHYLAGKKQLTMLALGCGIGSHERRFAGFQDTFARIDAYDIAPNLIQHAQGLAKEAQLHNIHFHCADINGMALPEAEYDIVFFHSSLHHFVELEALITKKIPQALKPGGLLLLNDYWGPNRLQWTKAQLQEINRLLQEIPAPYRRRFRSQQIKGRVSGPGWLRMLLSDPSEAAEAEKIQPLLRKHYQSLEEKAIGGSLLMPLLKDIAHHYVEEKAETQAILEQLFAAEDRFLEKEPSILFFGVYQPK